MVTKLADQSPFSTPSMSITIWILLLSSSFICPLLIKQHITLPYEMTANYHSNNTGNITVKKSTDSFMVIKWDTEKNKMVHSMDLNSDTFQDYNELINSKYNYSSITNTNNNQSWYELLSCLNSNQCSLNKNDIWMMFIGDSNSRQTMLRMIDSLRGKSGITVIDRINVEIQQQFDIVSKSKQCFYEDGTHKMKWDDRWIDKEWFIIIKKYVFRISFRFLQNMKRNEKFDFIDNDLNNIGVECYNISLVHIQNMSSAISKFVRIGPEKPDIMYVSHGLWGLTNLVQNTIKKSNKTKYMNFTQTWTYTDIAKYLKHWKEEKEITVFWITNFRLKWHSTISLSDIEFDVNRTKLNAKKIDVPVFSMYDTIIDQLFDEVDRFHYNTSAQDVYQKFVVINLLIEFAV